MKKWNNAGIVFEGDFFGEDARQHEPNTIIPYKKLPDALQHVRDNQKLVGWNPQRPTTSLSGSLFISVRKKLPPNIAPQLHLYCALGSALDIHFGIDGFFEIPRYCYATFDLATSLSGKLRKIKESGGKQKAFIIVPRDGVWDDKKQMPNMPEVEKIAHKIAAKLLYGIAEQLYKQP